MYLIWIVISVLSVPMFQMSAKELAPSEDQGVIFGILDASADSTLDQTSMYAAAANRVFMSTAESRFTFQVTFPASGFGGLVVAPWEQRDRTVAQILPEVQAGLAAIPGIRMFPVTPPALPGGGDFPVEIIRRRRRSSGLPSNSSSRQCKAACSPSRRSST
jgi:multidrug efflux pump